MPNMSYCMFENTFKDLQDVQERGDWDSTELSESETKYRQKLLDLCRELADCQFNWEEK